MRVRLRVEYQVETGASGGVRLVGEADDEGALAAAVPGKSHSAVVQRVFLAEEGWNEDAVEPPSGGVRGTARPGATERALARRGGAAPQRALRRGVPGDVLRARCGCRVAVPAVARRLERLDVVPTAAEQDVRNFDRTRRARCVDLATLIDHRRRVRALRVDKAGVGRAAKVDLRSDVRRKNQLRAAPRNDVRCDVAGELLQAIVAETDRDDLADVRLGRDVVKVRPRADRVRRNGTGPHARCRYKERIPRLGSKLRVDIGDGGGERGN